MPLIHLYRPRSYFSTILPRKVRDSLGEAFDAIAQMADADIARLTQPASKRPLPPVLVIQL